VPALSTLSELLRNQLLTTPVEINHATPFTLPKKPLTDSRAAVVTSAGLHLQDDRSFVQYDPSYRIIPSQTRASDLRQSHVSLHFDRAPMLQDINVVFPLDRLREMADRGDIGSVAPNFYSFMGAQHDLTNIRETTAPALAARLTEELVDIVFLTPTCPGCTRTICTIARVLEEHGFPTVAITSVREHTVKLAPPRALWVPFPFGVPLGQPDQPAEQQNVIDAAFALLDANEGPVLQDFVTSRPEEYGIPLQASDVVVSEAVSKIDLATEVTLMRRYWEQRYAASGRTNVGISKISPARFRGIVRFLEGYAAGTIDDFAERSVDVNLPSFIVQCVTDLRAMYFEARMQTHPKEDSRSRERWLLTETALGQFLNALNARMNASGDPEMINATRSVRR
jgi:D-proline reductase (dithiol) PrdB